MADPDKMKRDIIPFYEMMFNECRPRVAIERHAGGNYIQHNPHVASGKRRFIDCFERIGQSRHSALPSDLAGRA